MYTGVGRATEKGWKTVSSCGQGRVKILNAYFKMSTVSANGGGGNKDRYMWEN